MYDLKVTRSVHGKTRPAVLEKQFYYLFPRRTMGTRNRSTRYSEVGRHSRGRGNPVCQRQTAGFRLKACRNDGAAENGLKACRNDGAAENDVPNVILFKPDESIIFANQLQKFFRGDFSRHIGSIQQAVRQIPLFLVKTDNLFFDGSSGYQPVDRYRVLLADAVGPV